jgi:hypothetical protein
VKKVLKKTRKRANIIRTMMIQSIGKGKKYIIRTMIIHTVHRQRKKTKKVKASLFARKKKVEDEN